MPSQVRLSDIGFQPGQDGRDTSVIPEEKPSGSHEALMGPKLIKIRRRMCRNTSVQTFFGVESDALHGQGVKLPVLTGSCLPDADHRLNRGEVTS